MKYIIASLMIISTSCISRAKFIEQNYQSPRSGKVMYGHNIFSSNEAAMTKAEKLMSDFCAPQGFVILQRTIEETGTVTFSQSSASAQQLPVLRFECR